MNGTGEQTDYRPKTKAEILLDMGHNNIVSHE
jgi:hypothetical protein